MKRKANRRRTGVAMQLRQKLLATLITGLVAAGLIIAVWNAVAPSSRGATVEVTVPALSAIAATGKTVFDANSASCHGANAAGTDKEPPLIHDIYNPGHRNNAAFYRAARNVVSQHHWPFGDMPPQRRVADQELAAIVRYVRELRKANGIFYRPHTM